MDRERFTRREFFHKVGETTKDALALGITALALAATRRIPALNGIFPKPPEQLKTDVEYWDGTEMRKNPFGGRKIVFIPGINTNSQDDNTFDRMKDALKEIGYDEKDFLDMTYDIDESSELLGKHYNSADANQSLSKSLHNTSKMVEWMRKKFPEDELWFMGHSQGGYIALELAKQLAKKEPEKVGGVMTFNGAIKGADIVPTRVDDMLAWYVGGQAAQDLLELAHDPQYADRVDKDIENLVKVGVPVFNFASTQDKVVTPRFSSSRASLTRIAGKAFRTVFPMDKWQSIKSARNLASRLKYYTELGYISDTPIAGASASIDTTSERLVNDQYSHGAVVNNGEVIETVKFIVDAVPFKKKHGMAQKSEEVERENEKIRKTEEEALKNWKR